MTTSVVAAEVSLAAAATKDEACIFVMNEQEPEPNNNETKAFLDDVHSSSLSTTKSLTTKPNQIQTGSESKKVSFVSSLNEPNSMMCRICHSEEPAKDLIAPCNCSGSLKYVHQECLQHWLKINGTN